MSIKVGIVGATGYTALELARILAAHPDAEIVAATSRSDAGKPLAEIHPSLIGQVDLQIESFEAKSIAEKSDVVMCCLPHAQVPKRSSNWFLTVFESSTLVPTFACRCWRLRKVVRRPASVARTNRHYGLRDA